MAIVEFQRANDNHDHLNDNQISRQRNTCQSSETRKDGGPSKHMGSCGDTIHRKPVTHRSHLDRCAQPRLDCRARHDPITSTPPLTRVLQLRFLHPHTLRCSGVLKGVEVSATTRSRRFGLNRRVAIARHPATAAFLDDGENVMCSYHAL